MSPPRPRWITALATSLALSGSCPAFAQWAPNGAPVCTATGTQQLPAIASDPAGASIIAWSDARGSSPDIYVQRMSASGQPQWTPNGVLLCGAAFEQSVPAVVPDGAGGAIVVWLDRRSNGRQSDIYARRVSSAGTPMWAADGVPVCTATGDQDAPTLVSDGAGGVVVAWLDHRTSSGSDVYAQRLSPSGAPMWTVNGVKMSAVTSGKQNVATTSDGAGGAIVTWQDSRTDVADIYVQRISAAGALPWGSAAVGLCTSVNQQILPAIAADGAGGAIVTWQDFRNGVDFDIYARRIDEFGAPQWVPNGVPVCTAAQGQRNPLVASDASGGALITWGDYRDGQFYATAYAQRLGPSGIRMWTTDGVVVCSSATVHIASSIGVKVVGDGFGGAICVWEDARADASHDIYAQYVNSEGTPRGPATGIPVCTASGAQTLHSVTSDGSGAALVTWQDSRSPVTSYDIYAQHVRLSDLVTGVTAPVAAGFELATPYPNPASAGTTLRFQLAAARRVTAEVFDVNGRLVRRLGDGGELSPGAHTLSWDTTNAAGSQVAAGLYLVRVGTGDESAVQRVTVIR